MQIEGVPEGWELVAFRPPQEGEWFISGDCTPLQANCSFAGARAVIRKKPRIQDTYTIPDGFRTLKPDEVCKKGDYFINAGADAPCGVYASVGMTQKQAEKEWETILLLRKIERPKKYRPFANAAEYAPHRDRWVRRASTKYPNRKGCWKASYYTDCSAVVTEADMITTYREIFEAGYVFDDTGEPFGVEVSE